MSQVGVIIPAYNAVRFLAATLDSVRAQTLQDWTCIIVDDGSTDQTLCVAEAYATMDPRIQVLPIENGGQARARNIGACALDPAILYLAFLDSDDLWEPDALAALLAAIEGDTDATAVAGLARDVDIKGALLEEDYSDVLRHATARFRRGVAGWRLVAWEANRPSSLETLSVWCHIETPGLVLIRRSAFMRTEGFRTSTSPSEDWDLWLQLARLGPILHLPDVVLRKRVVPGSESRQRRRMRRAEPGMRRLWARHSGLSSNERRTLIVGHFYACLERFRWARNEASHGDLILALEHVRHGVVALGRFVLIHACSRMPSRRRKHEPAVASVLRGSVE